MNRLVGLINQYYLSEDDSPVHRLDPRTKILLVLTATTLLIFVRHSYAALIPAALITLGFAALTRKLAAIVAPLLVCGLSFALLAGFVSIAYNRPAVLVCTCLLAAVTTLSAGWCGYAFLKKERAGSIAFVYLIPLAIFTILGWLHYIRLARPDFFAAFYGKSGVEYFFRAMFLRLLPVVTLMFTLVLTTRPADMIRALRQIHVPQKILFPATIMIRFFPTFVGNVAQIIDSMKLRGFSLSLSNIIRRPGLFLRALLTPLILRSVKASDELAAAAESRGFRLDAKTSAYRKLAFRRYDAVAVLILIAFCVWAIPAEIAAQSEVEQHHRDQKTNGTTHNATSSPPADTGAAIRDSTGGEI